jgi:hypothetical protein
MGGHGESTFREVPEAQREGSQHGLRLPYVSVVQGEDCIVVLVAEPEAGLIRVGYRVGSRHPLTVGAAGIAIRAPRPQRPGEPDAVEAARRDGYCVTTGQLEPLTPAAVLA